LASVKAPGREDPRSGEDPRFGEDSDRSGKSVSGVRKEVFRWASNPSFQTGTGRIAPFRSMEIFLSRRHGACPPVLANPKTRLHPCMGMQMQGDADAGG